MTSDKLLKSAKRILAVLLVFLFSVSIPQAAFASSEENPDELHEANTYAEDTIGILLDGFEFMGFTESPLKNTFSAFLDILYDILETDISEYFSELIDGYGEDPLKTIFSIIYDFLLSIFDGDSEATRIYA